MKQCITCLFMFASLLISTDCCPAKFSPSKLFSSVKDSMSEWIKGTKEEEVKTRSFELNHNSTVDIHNNKGSITVKSWNQPKLLVEVTKKGSPELLQKTTIDVTTKAHYAHISVNTPENKESDIVTDIHIVVPHTTSLNLTTHTGKIKVENVQGFINATTDEGKISIAHAQSSITAKAPAGKIKVKQQSLNPMQSIFLEARDDVKLYLSSTIEAHINARTAQGTVTSNIYLSLDPITTQLDSEFWNRIKKSIKASIGEGGAPITIDVTKGNISILEY